MEQLWLRLPARKLRALLATFGGVALQSLSGSFIKLSERFLCAKRAEIENVAEVPRAAKMAHPFHLQTVITIRNSGKAFWCRVKRAESLPSPSRRASAKPDSVATEAPNQRASQ